MIHTLTDDNYEELLEKERIAVVKVYAPWCGPCKFMKSHYEKWSAIYAGHKGNNVKFFELENDKNREFIAHYKVEKLPTIMFFVNGVHTHSIQGMTRASVFENILDQALATVIP